MHSQLLSPHTKNIWNLLDECPPGQCSLWSSVTQSPPQGFTEMKKTTYFSTKGLQPRLPVYLFIYLSVYLSTYLALCRLKIALVFWRATIDCWLLLPWRSNETPGLPLWTSISPSPLQQWSIWAWRREFTFVSMDHIFLGCAPFTFLKIWASVWLRFSCQSPDVSGFSSSVTTSANFCRSVECNLALSPKALNYFRSRTFLHDISSHQFPSEEHPSWQRRPQKIQIMKESYGVFLLFVLINAKHWLQHWT